MGELQPRTHPPELRHDAAGADGSSVRLPHEVTGETIRDQDRRVFVSSVLLNSQHVSLRRKLWQQTQTSSCLNLRSSEKAICCSKTPRSDSSTRATWISAPSLERSFSLTQKESLPARPPVRRAQACSSPLISQRMMCSFILLTTDFLELCEQDLCSIT